MGFTLLDYHLEGAFKNPSDLPPGAGVYVIWCKDGKTWVVLDVGESEDVRERVMNHDRADCWKKHCSGEIWYSATYDTNQQTRRRIEQHIRKEGNLPC